MTTMSIIDLVGADETTLWVLLIGLAITAVSLLRHHAVSRRRSKRISKLERMQSV